MAMIHMRARTGTHRHRHGHTHTQTHARMHARTHTHTHTHIHTTPGGQIAATETVSFVCVVCVGGKFGVCVSVYVCTNESKYI